MKFTQVNISKKVTLCFILLFLGLMSASITHAAETYTYNKSLDNPNSFFLLDNPYDVAIDSSNNVFVADYIGSRIQEIYSNGSWASPYNTISTPTSVAVNSSDVVYAIDNSNDLYRAISGSWATVNTSLTSSPYGVATDPDGNVFVSIQSTNKIQKLKYNGTFTSQISPTYTPYGIAVNSTGYVYVAGSDGTIHIYSNSLASVATLGSDFSTPRDVAIDSSDNVYVADTGNNKFLKYKPNGNLVTSVTNTSISPYGIDVNSSGFVYLADLQNHSNKYYIQVYKENKVTPTISWTPTPTTITYGTALLSSQLNATAWEGANNVSSYGYFNYTLQDGTQVTTSTVLGNGSYAITAKFTSTDVNYTSNLTGVQRTIIVNKATPTITWSSPANITYPTALSSTQNNAIASVPGTFVYTPENGTVLNAGNNQNLHVDFTPNDTVNYTNTTADVTINVTEKSILPVANFSTNVNEGYAPLSVQFNDSSENATSVSWDFENDGVIDSIENDLVHEFTTVGIYTVNLTAINGNGTASKLATINVTEKPILPVANFTADIDTRRCSFNCPV